MALATRSLESLRGRGETIQDWKVSRFQSLPINYHCGGENGVESRSLLVAAAVRRFKGTTPFVPEILYTHCCSISHLYG